VIVALLVVGAPANALAAGCEEEGVPLELREALVGTPLELARQASKASADGIGIGGDSRHLALVLAAAPGRAYLDATAGDARAFAQAAARIAARRPLRFAP